jgi:hypothetical protein
LPEELLTIYVFNWGRGVLSPPSVISFTLKTCFMQERKYLLSPEEAFWEPDDDDWNPFVMIVVILGGVLLISWMIS